ncbi:hypothetical protein VNO78_05551 [Psophocarpus tetragonolobus]|uniref:Uncharacterized protein n=1 Tax=Psophocarpus tetragonolobus TaxID=3891 RepID=A0AAN9SSI1_PSOTE
MISSINAQTTKKCLAAKCGRLPISPTAALLFWLNHTNSGIFKLVRWNLSNVLFDFISLLHWSRYMSTDEDRVL